MRQFGRSLLLKIQTNKLTNMDISQIVIMVFSFATPFLLKSGEAIAEKLGEDVWSLLKRPFSEDAEKQLIEKVEKDPSNPQNKLMLQNAFALKLEHDAELLNEVKGKLKHIQSEISSNSEQIINNWGKISTQINIKDNFAPIQIKHDSNDE